MHPSLLGAEMNRIHIEDLVAGARRRPATGWGGRFRRGLGEQLEAVRRRLELGRGRRGPLSQIQIGRYTGARV